MHNNISIQSELSFSHQILKGPPLPFAIFAKWEKYGKEAKIMFKWHQGFSLFYYRFWAVLVKSNKNPQIWQKTFLKPEESRSIWSCSPGLQWSYELNILTFVSGSCIKTTKVRWMLNTLDISMYTSIWYTHAQNLKNYRNV